MLVAVSCLLATSTAQADGLTRDQKRVRVEIIRVFGSRAPTALRVSWCEGRWLPWAWNGGSAGPFQADYGGHHLPGESTAAFRSRFANVRYAVRWAYRLSQGGTDWHDWRWSAHCWGGS